MYQKFLTSKYAKGLTDGQLHLFKIFLETSDNIFLTSEAGCGKSFVINRLSEYCNDNNILLSKTASTGVSAVNIGAQTIHSFMGMGIADCDSDILVKKINKNKQARQRIQNCNLILIEECSMISGEVFQKIYDIFRYFKYKLPRFIVSADFFQISPVFKVDKLYAFESKAWSDLKFNAVILTEIIRQDSNSDFAKFLSRVRKGDTSNMDIVKERTVINKIPKGTLAVYSKNIDVDAHNDNLLSATSGNIMSYKSEDTGDKFHVENLDKNCLAPAILKLKVGVPVMLVKNDIDKGLSNGSMGEVVKMNKNSVDVKFESGVFTIEQDVWKIEESYLDSSGKVKNKLLASRTQIPLRLAFSVSGHKIQSITIDKIAIDLGNCFAPGLAYCMLSRARTKNGLYIKNYNPSSIKVDKRCVEFYNKLL